MDAAGVDFGLLSAWSAPHQPPLISNEEVAGWFEGHPGRFAALACVDLNKPMEAVRELRRCVEELGFKGLRVVPWLWEAPPTDRRYYPLYAACVELGVPFFTQVGHTGPMRPSETGRPDSLHRPGRARLPRAGHRRRPHRLPLDRGDDRGGPQARERLHRYLGVHPEALSRGADRVHGEPRWAEQGPVRNELPDDLPASGARRSRRTRSRAGGSRSSSWPATRGDSCS